MFFLKKKKGFISVDIITAVSVSVLILYILTTSVSNLAKFDSKTASYKKIIYLSEEILNNSLDNIENGIAPDKNNEEKIILDGNNVLTVNYEIIDKKRKIYKVCVSSDRKDGMFVLLEGYEKHGEIYE